MKTLKFLLLTAFLCIPKVWTMDDEIPAGPANAQPERPSSLRSASPFVHLDIVNRGYTSPVPYSESPVNGQMQCVSPLLDTAAFSYADELVSMLNDGVDGDFMRSGVENSWMDDLKPAFVGALCVKWPKLYEMSWHKQRQNDLPEEDIQQMTMSDIAPAREKRIVGTFDELGIAIIYNAEGQTLAKLDHGGTHYVTRVKWLPDGTIITHDNGQAEAQTYRWHFIKPASLDEALKQCVISRPTPKKKPYVPLPSLQKKQPDIL